MEVLNSILGQVGIDPERVWLRWIGASEGTLFRDTVKEMVDAIRAKGPNLMQKPWELWQQTFGFWKPQAFGALRVE